MTSLFIPTRHAYRCSAPVLRTFQRRWAQVHDIRFLATHNKPEKKVLDKYKAKLEQKAKQEGLGDINELKEVYKDKIETLRKKAIVAGADAFLHAENTPNTASSAASVAAATSPKNIPFQPPPPPQPQAAAGAQPTKPSHEAKAGIKTLDSFVDVEKMLDLPRKEIEYLWRLRHASTPNSLCATIPLEVYEKIASTAKKHPQFILPLPREGQGAEIHFLQWTFPSPTTATVLFTHLAEFKLRGEFAQPHTTLTHHLDLADPKGLVLLEGLVTEDRGVTVDESKWLLMCLQKFYGQTSEESPRKKLMEQFSQGDTSFKVEELLEEAEKIV
ncbi:hypothetical protein AAFC00_007253 [Neodothiora populina]|uniref:F1F0 ATP synthase assembly protein-like protein Atp11 n=1 Tax=Neodothiora populina TaxID=2781224 RepID=A0ABR3PI12_9PEZI